ncbi:hypothetical protein [Paludisphaera soli]|uniref:hypothetical protein n=1 Tax=Paludisphaera soli TaxID=2712865 RepID=UPI0013EC476F|nr:hypothetical protein [Paludisphaera soli]
MAGENDPVAFRHKDGRRIARAVRRSEGQPPTGGDRPVASAWGWSPGVLRARVTTAIPAGTMSSPSSSGRVRLWHRVDGAWAEIAEDVEVWNDHAFTSSVAVNKAVKVGWIGLQLWLVQADC